MRASSYELYSGPRILNNLQDLEKMHVFHSIKMFFKMLDTKSFLDLIQFLNTLRYSVWDLPSCNPASFQRQGNVVQTVAVHRNAHDMLVKSSSELRKQWAWIFVHNIGYLQPNRYIQKMILDSILTFYLLNLHLSVSYCFTIPAGCSLPWKTMATFSEP